MAFGLTLSLDFMTTSTRAYFGVFGFGDDPAVVTALMRMPPTQAWVKGERSDSRFPEAHRTHSRWALSSGVDETAPVEAHFADLLTKLESRREEIGLVSQRFPVKIVVVQYVYETNPQFTIESDTLRRFADLGIRLCFDQYCLGEGDSRD